VIRVTSACGPAAGVTALGCPDGDPPADGDGQLRDGGGLSDGDPARGGHADHRGRGAADDRADRHRGAGADQRADGRDTVGLRDEPAAQPEPGVRTEQMIRDLLAREGSRSLSIDTTLVPVPDSRARTGSHSTCGGEPAGDRDIQFEGNEAFSDGDAARRDEHAPEGFLWFRTGRFDRETFQEDLRERLPSSTGARVHRLRGGLRHAGRGSGDGEGAAGGGGRGARSTGWASSRSRARRASRRAAGADVHRAAPLGAGLPFGGRSERERGEVFDRAALDAATQRVQQMYRNEGYLYAQVEPIVQRVPRGPTAAADGQRDLGDLGAEPVLRQPDHDRGEHLHARVGDPRPAARLSRATSTARTGCSRATEHRGARLLRDAAARAGHPPGPGERDGRPDLP
jgi:hypothetical protein